MEMTKTGTSMFISAGDISGDIHAGGLIKQINRLRPGLSWEGLGGTSLKEAGCRLLEEPDREPVMGFRRVIGKIPHYFKLLARIAEHLRTTRPAAVILVDYPGLNMRIAALAKRLGIPVIYFICPQYWAWAPWRVKHFSRFVDLALVIFPFEAPYFETHGVKSHYVGHPSCDRPADDHIEKQAECNLPEGEILAVLPGSRRQEIYSNLPAMLEAAKAILKVRHQWIPVLTHYDGGMLKIADAIAERHGVPLTTLCGGMKKTARTARFCLVGSGTATLEVAFTKTPMAVVYKASSIACALAPYLLTVPYFCQVNLMAGEELVPEVLLNKDDPAPILSKTLPLVRDEALYDDIQNRLTEFAEKFNRPGALGRAAKIIVESF